MFRRIPTTSGINKQHLFFVSAARHRSSRSQSGRSIVPAYGPELHGPLREPTSTFPPEPYDLWLACRNSVAPFRNTAVVLHGGGRRGGGGGGGAAVGDNDADNAHSKKSGERFCDRARKHFANVFSVPVTWNQDESSSAPKKQISPSSNLSAAKKKATNEETRLITTDEKKDLLVIPEELLNLLGADHSGSSDGGITMPVTLGVDVIIAHAGLIPCRSPRDISAIMKTYQPLMRPHSCFCLTGAALPSAELLCNDADTVSDWADLCDWIREKSTPEELFSFGSKKVVDGEGSGGTFLPYEIIKPIASSCGLINCTLHTFDAEYPVTMRHLGGLVRSMPAYRREVARKTFSEDGSNSGGEEEEKVAAAAVIGGADDTTLTAAASTNTSRPVFVSRRPATAAVAVDPFDCFQQLVSVRYSSSSSAQPVMRLRIKYWMWVCDRRPRSKDSVRFQSMEKRKRIS